MSWDRTTPGDSFCAGMKRLQGSPSLLGCNASRGVILSWVGTTPGGPFDIGWNVSRGVLLSWDRKTPWGSIRPRTEGRLESHSVLG